MWALCHNGLIAANALLLYNAPRRNAMRRLFGFFIGILVGGLVGSTIALLLAPESGEALRERLRERGLSVVNEIRAAADTRRIELRDRLDTLRAPRET
jgi:hypothetical protein